MYVIIWFTHVEYGFLLEHNKKAYTENTYTYKHICVWKHIWKMYIKGSDKIHAKLSMAITSQLKGVSFSWYLCIVKFFLTCIFILNRK